MNENSYEIGIALAPEVRSVLCKVHQHGYTYESALDLQEVRIADAARCAGWIDRSSTVGGGRRLTLTNAGHVLLQLRNDGMAPPDPNYNPLWPEWPDGLEFTAQHNEVLRKSATEAGLWNGPHIAHLHLAASQAMRFGWVKYEALHGYYAITDKGRALLRKLAAPRTCCQPTGHHCFCGCHHKG